MARIRTIKPQIWTSEQFVECSTTARLMFIGLLNFCDDNGIHKKSCKTIKMEVFPSDDISIDEIKSMLDELESNELIHSYASNNKEYFIVTGWHHQKIDKPNFTHPVPDNYAGYIRQFPDGTDSSQQPFDDRSTTAHPRNVMEGKVKEGNKEKSQPAKQANPHTPYQKIWDLYKKYLNGNPDHNLVDIQEMSDKRKTRIKSLWIKFGRDIEKMESYFSWLYDKRQAHIWIFGENNRGWIADIEFICRDDTYTKAIEGRLNNWSKAA